MTPLATSLDNPVAWAFPAPVGELLSISVRALTQMYRPEKGMFSFCVRRGATGASVEGVSRRYTAISLIGLAAAMRENGGSLIRPGDREEVEENTPLDILSGESLSDLTGRLLGDVDTVETMGDVALTLWAAHAVGHAETGRARDRLLAMEPWDRPCPTVELAWALTALSHAVDQNDADPGPSERVARRLLKTFVSASDLFPHWPVGAKPAMFRGHVCCFADLVYPTQALALYHRRSGDPDAASVARRCAAKMCALQGPSGQWWWHFDARTGRVVEPYPVYAVHQDSMAPMALLDLQEACGDDHQVSIERGLQWLERPIERDGSLIDAQAGIVWRKVARREPGKLSRSAQALFSCVHPALRAWGLDLVFRPGAVDWESRPYHFGWILYAWCNRRLTA